MNELYQWMEKTNDFRKERGELVWTLDLFREHGAVLPFLNKQRDIARHKIEITTFSPRPYERPYRQEKASEGPDTITYRKVFLSDYTGNVDAEFGILWEGSVDSMGRGAAYFLDGELKDSCGASDHRRFKTPEEFKRDLTEYFKGSTQNFGKHLGNLIINSNLPDRQRNAVRALWE